MLIIFMLIQISYNLLNILNFSITFFLLFFLYQLLLIVYLLLYFPSFAVTRGMGQQMSTVSTAPCNKPHISQLQLMVVTSCTATPGRGGHGGLRTTTFTRKLGEIYKPTAGAVRNHQLQPCVEDSTRCSLIRDALILSPLFQVTLLRSYYCILNINGTFKNLFLLFAHVVVTCSLNVMQQQKGENIWKYINLCQEKCLLKGFQSDFHF